MKRTSSETPRLSSRMQKSAWIVLAIPTLALLTTFQNCSKVEFGDAASLKSTTPGEKQSQFATLTAGDAATFPPLKLVFVVDNSGTMQVNQINLAQAFGKMFEGANATNLAPFDSTAYVINTAQKTIDANDSNLFAKLPKKGMAELSTMSLADIRGLRGGSVTEGQLAGDLAGYAAVASEKDGLKTLSYLPMPVLGLEGSTVDLGVRKLAGGSVQEFSRAFSDRISVLDPARSAIDPTTRRGILDPIVDQESGLCAVARVLNSKNGMINKGDLTAFVIVSDEDDADPQGVNCIEKFQETRGTDSLVDGRCERPTSTISFFREITTPEGPKCQVSYSTALNYKYEYPYDKTTATYKKKRYEYQLRRTLLKYKLASYTADQEKTKVSYYTKNPTYKIARTTISYFTQSKSCDMRDGIEVNCKYSYPTASTTVDGTASGAQCASFSDGKIPANAIKGNAQYPISCVAAAARSVNGACSTADADKLDCQQNYSTVKTTELAGRFGSNCAAFVAGKLESGAIYTEAGKMPTCADATSVTAAKTGRCPANAINCSETYVSKEEIFDGFAGTGAACSTFATAKIKSIAGAVYENAAQGNLPTCTPASDRTVAANGNACPPDTTDRHSCRMVAGTSNGSVVLASKPANGQSCADAMIAQNKTPADLSNQFGEAIVCNTEVLTATDSGEIKYTNSNLPNYVASTGACPQGVIDAIKSKSSIPTNPSKCTIESVSRATDTLANRTCADASASAVCSASNGTKRGCTYADVAAGAKFESARTNQTVEEILTCDTKCSDTNVCKDKSGTVADNYNSCVVTGGKKTVKSITAGLNANKANLCDASDSLVVTKGPYFQESRPTTYIAGDRSKNAEPNALSNYIAERSEQLFGTLTPSVSVFVRQKNDAMGTNGSEGKAYNAFATKMGGQTLSVLSGADKYASSLQSLSGVIRSKLDRSMSIPGFQADQKVMKAWHRSGTTGNWVEVLEGVDWTASGGTVTLSDNFSFKFGDQFQFEFK